MLKERIGARRRTSQVRWMREGGALARMSPLDQASVDHGSHWREAEGLHAAESGTTFEQGRMGGREFTLSPK
jgi:hypothetical protein